MSIQAAAATNETTQAPIIGSDKIKREPARKTRHAKTTPIEGATAKPKTPRAKKAQPKTARAIKAVKAKAKAKEIKEEVETDEKKERPKMAKQLAAARTRYEPCIAAGGSVSLNNGDDVANYLAGKTWEEVCQIADEAKPLPDGQTHAQKYAKLNNGQKRMNAGNKIRNAVKKGEYTLK